MADVSEVREILNKVRSRLKVTKVVATRAVKTKGGDFFAGMSAAWDSVQDDAGGPGADLDLTVEGSEVAASGMTLTESRVSSVVLAMEASIAAWRAAMLEGAVSESEFDNRVARIRQKAMNQVSNIIDKANPPRIEKVA